MKSTFFSTTASFLAIVIAVIGTIFTLGTLSSLATSTGPVMGGFAIVTSISVLFGSWTAAALLGTLAEIARK
jgi:hypothetical protein